MGLKADIPELLAGWKNQEDRRAHDASLIRIYEGDLKTELIEHLKIDMPTTWRKLEPRLSTINVLKRLVDKLSKIYQQNITRAPSNDNESAQSLLDYYTDSMQANVYFNLANEHFNLTKTCLLQPYAYRGMPRMRVVPADKFYVMSKDEVDRSEPTHIMVHMGKTKESIDYFYAWTAQEFLCFDRHENIIPMLDNPDNVNPLGVLPMVYARRARAGLIPTVDSDLKQMALLIPLLLSDLNYAIKWQAYSIIIFLNAKGDNLTRDPGVVWEIKSDNPDNPDAKPEIQTVKPEVDIPSVLQAAAEQLGLWLQTQGVKPGAVGSLSGDNFSSGISKMIDEMDTYENRLVQVDYFKAYERQFWDLALNYYHPYWTSNRLIQPVGLWTGGMVSTQFARQTPIEDRGAVVDVVEKEMRLGLLLKVDALKRLNPGWSDKQCEAYLELVEQEGQDAPATVNA